MGRAVVSAAVALALGSTASAAAPSVDTELRWAARTHDAIAELEYRASPAGDGLQAPNRAHGLRTWFEPTGIRVDERSAAGSALLSLRLAGFGRGPSLAPVAPGELASDGPRVEIRREGLLEWYVNSRAGLEQGFTLATRPAGEGPLVFELAVAGARPSLRGGRVVLVSASGRRFAYGKLEARDGAGRRFAGRLEVPDRERIRLVVDDAGAAYPLVIDPLLEELPDAQLESDQADSGFGLSLAGAGDVNGDGYGDLIVGAPFYDAGQQAEGAAFVFLGSATGPGGAPAAQLESEQASAQLGASVGQAGDVNGDGFGDVVVGAPGYGAPAGGAAFVFLGSAAGIDDGTPASAAARLLSDQTSALLGASVDRAGDVNGDGYGDVVVGAPGYGAPAGGAAFVFLGSAAGIDDGTPASAAARLLSDQAAALFGESVAGAGDVSGDGYADVVVGASDYGAPAGGGAFVFVGSATGIAHGTPASAASRLLSDQPAAQLGASVAGAGDVNGDGRADVVVGAPLYDSGESDEGAAFVFHGSATGIAHGSPASAAARLEADQPDFRMGASVAGAGDVDGDGYADVLVAAPRYSGGQALEGAAFVFLGGAAGIASGGSGAAGARLEPDQPGAEMGQVAGAGDLNGDGYADVVAGAAGFDAELANEGAVFAYLGGGAGIADGSPASAAAQLEADQAHAWMGRSVAGAGDVNGDGYGDLIVGAPYYDAGQNDEGAVFVFHGSAAGIPDATPAAAATQLESNQARARLGYHVAGAGDVNGDGYADVIAGAPLYDGGQLDEGAAFVFLGSAAGVADGSPASAAARLEGNQAKGSMGSRVAAAGDVNGDGYADVMVGAPNYDLGQFDSGAAFVFHGSAAGIADGGPATAATRFDSNQVRAYMGDVGCAGDVNGDGYADVVVGVPNYDAGQEDEGLALLFFGGPSGIADGTPATAATRFEGNQVQAYLGSRVAGAGDVNGDGYADVIVTATSYDSGQEDEGAAFVFLGGAAGIADASPATAATQIESDQLRGRMGFSAAGAGDVNGDGYADIVVGASQQDSGQEDEGAILVLLGSAAGIADATPATAAALLESDQAGGQLGYDAGAGDLNGDGFADVFGGAVGYDAGEDHEGAVFIFLGGGGGGRPVLARQRRAGGGAPVEAWGRAGSASELRLEIRASSPDGAGRVAAEVERCPPGEAFGEPGCTTTRSAWAPVGGASPEALLTHDLSGLAANVLLRWRARVLRAPATGALPALPAHGPWRRLQAQTIEADVRATLSDCSDEFDDDGDGAVDHPADGGCTSAGDASEREPGRPCDDDLDNDFDLFADHPADGGCASADDPSEEGVGGACENGIDDDGDGSADFPADAGCTHADDLSEREPGRPCDDGFDNDGDGLIDFPADPGCQNAAFGKENPQCQDGLNNDLQAGIDFDGGASVNGGVPLSVPDPHCSSPWRDTELGSCGLGFELAPLLILLRFVRRRRRSID